MNPDLVILATLLVFGVPGILFGFYVLGGEAWKGFCKYRGTPPKLSDRDVRINKQIADLKITLRRNARCDRRMAQKCQRLERRVTRLEKINKGEN